MKTCRWFKEIEIYVDGETARPETVEAHLATCPACAAHRDSLLTWRGVTRPLATPVLSDEQFPAFMAGIRAELDAPRRRHGGFWALMSLTAAALVIAIAVFSIFTGPTNNPTQATEVKSVSTDIDNATVSVETPEDGVTTIRVNINKDDILP